MTIKEIVFAARHNPAALKGYTEPRGKVFKKIFNREMWLMRAIDVKLYNSTYVCKYES